MNPNSSKIQTKKNRVNKADLLSEIPQYTKYSVHYAEASMKCFSTILGVCPRDKRESQGKRGKKNTHTHRKSRITILVWHLNKTHKKSIIETFGLFGNLIMESSILKGTKLGIKAPCFGIWLSLVLPPVPLLTYLKSQPPQMAVLNGFKEEGPEGG